MFTWTLFRGADIVDNASQNFLCSLNTLCQSNGFFFQMFQLVSLLLNICLCYDLIKTIQSPFTPAGNRAKFYYIFSIFVPLIVGVFIVIFNEVAGDGTFKNCETCLDKHPSSSI